MRQPQEVGPSHEHHNERRHMLLMLLPHLSRMTHQGSELNSTEFTKEQSAPCH
jgi:hypothetical protein